MIKRTWALAFISVGLAACQSSSSGTKDAAAEHGAIDAAIDAAHDATIDVAVKDAAADAGPAAVEVSPDVTATGDAAPDLAPEVGMVVDAGPPDRAPDSVPDLAPDLAVTIDAGAPEVGPGDAAPGDHPPGLELSFSNCITSLVGSAVNVSAVSSAAVAVTDFDFDHKADLAMVTRPDNRLITLRGKGDGTFQIVSGKVLAGSAGDVCAGDFNGDGTPDVVVGGPQASNLNLFLGSASGAVGDPTVFPGPGGGRIAVGDVDGDGALDLVMGNSTLGSVSLTIFLGTGHGAFGQAWNVRAGTESGAPVLGDFDHDGNLDVAVTAVEVDVNHFMDGVVVLHGLGDATFDPPVSYPTGQAPFQNVLGDFNLDGNLDIATSYSGGTAVTVLLGNGDGSFRSTLSNVFASSSFVAADFNLDGVLDLAAVGYSNNLAIYPGNGDGTFASPVYSPLSLTNGPLAVADLDGDGRPDLILASASVGAIGEVCALMNTSK